MTHYPLNQNWYSINSHVKKQGRKRVTLSQPLMVTEIGHTSPFTLMDTLTPKNNFYN
jgi:hypothetical protein